MIFIVFFEIDNHPQIFGTAVMLEIVCDVAILLIILELLVVALLRRYHFPAQNLLIRDLTSHEPVYLLFRIKLLSHAPHLIGLVLALVILLRIVRSYLTRLQAQ